MEYTNKARTLELLEQGARLEEAQEPALLYTEDIKNIYAKTYEDLAEIGKASRDWFNYFLLENAYLYGLAKGYNLER